MGMDINIYTGELSANLIPKIQKRFADLYMDIEFHPEFKFDDLEDIGFLPIKFKIHPGHSKQYDNISFDIMTGFELIISDYDFEQELKRVQTENKRNHAKTFLYKFLGIKKTFAPIDNFVVDNKFDKLLENCKKEVLLNLKSWNKSELRVSLYFAAILAELTEGVILDPQSGRYLNSQEALQIFPKEIEEYESSFAQEEFTVDKFEGWLG